MKRALVLSGGGGKGSFQVGALKYLHEELNYTWDIIAGVSVGSLNASMVGMGLYNELEDLWRNISPDMVYNGSLGPLAPLRMLLKMGALDNRPLLRLIEQYYDPEAFLCETVVGAVSLKSGEFVTFRHDDPNFVRGVLASTSIPMVFSPVKIGGDLYVDGGIRNMTPLSTVFPALPDEIVVINASPRKIKPLPANPRTIFHLLYRVFSVATNEILETDIQQFMRINNMVQNARPHGAFFRKESGDSFRYFPVKILEPSEPVGDTLDFSQETARELIAAGWRRAKEVMG